MLVLSGCQANGKFPSSAESKEGTPDSQPESSSEIVSEDPNGNKVAEENPSLKELGITYNMLARSLVGGGDSQIRLRIANVMRKAQNGEPITVACIGGSITQGFNASAEDKKYPSLIKKWFEVNFPKAQVELINCGQGATGSIIGLHRAPDDLFPGKPDFVVVEFAKNDSRDFIEQTAYENLLRNILSQPQDCGVLSLCFFSDDGSNVEDIHEGFSGHYGIPQISVRNTVWPEIEAGRMKWSDYSNDTVHPLDRGHAIAAALVCDYLDGLLKNIDTIGGSVEPITKSYLTSDTFKDAKRLTPLNITVLSTGDFKVSDNAQWQFKDGFIAQGAKEGLKFEVTAKNIGFMWKMYIDGTGGTVDVYIDGTKIENSGELKGELNADFSGGYGEYCNRAISFMGNTAEKHTIELKPRAFSGNTKFTLLGVLVS